MYLKAKVKIVKSLLNLFDTFFTWHRVDILSIVWFVDQKNWPHQVVKTNLGSGRLNFPGNRMWISGVEMIFCHIIRRHVLSWIEITYDSISRASKYINPYLFLHYNADDNCSQFFICNIRFGLVMYDFNLWLEGYQFESHLMPRLYHCQRHTRLLQSKFLSEPYAVI